MVIGENHIKKKLKKFNNSFSYGRSYIKSYSALSLQKEKANVFGRSCINHNNKYSINISKPGENIVNIRQHC